MASTTVGGLNYSGSGTTAIERGAHELLNQSKKGTTFHRRNHSMIGKGTSIEAASQLRMDIDASERVIAGRNILSQRPSMALPAATIGASGPLKAKVSFDVNQMMK